MRRSALATVRLRRVTRRSWLIASTRMMRSPCGRTLTLQNALAVSQKGLKSVSSRTSQLYQPRGSSIRLHVPSEVAGHGVDDAHPTAAVDQTASRCPEPLALGLRGEHT